MDNDDYRDISEEESSERRKQIIFKSSGPASKSALEQLHEEVVEAVLDHEAGPDNYRNNMDLNEYDEFKGLDSEVKIHEGTPADERMDTFDFIIKLLNDPEVFDYLSTILDNEMEPAGIPLYEFIISAMDDQWSNDFTSWVLSYANNDFDNTVRRNIIDCLTRIGIERTTDSEGKQSEQFNISDKESLFNWYLRYFHRQNHGLCTPMLGKRGPLSEETEEDIERDKQVEQSHREVFEYGLKLKEFLDSYLNIFEPIKDHFPTLIIDGSPKIMKSEIPTMLGFIKQYCHIDFNVDLMNNLIIVATLIDQYKILFDKIREKNNNLSADEIHEYIAQNNVVRRNSKFTNYRTKDASNFNKEFFKYQAFYERDHKNPNTFVLGSYIHFEPESGESMNRHMNMLKYGLRLKDYFDNELSDDPDPDMIFPDPNENNVTAEKDLMEIVKYIEMMYDFSFNKDALMTIIKTYIK